MVACTVLATDAGRLKQSSLSVQSEQDGKASGPNARRAFLALLLASNNALVPVNAMVTGGGRNGRRLATLHLPGQSWGQQWLQETGMDYGDGQLVTDSKAELLKRELVKLVPLMALPLFKDESLADDFQFLSTAGEALTKHGFLKTLKHGDDNVYPDVSYDASSGIPDTYTQDPKFEDRIWFLLDTGMKDSAGHIEVHVCSITFNKANKVKLLTVGGETERQVYISSAQ